MSDGIAIVGLACCYAGANTPEELWENVLAQRRAFRKIPPERLRIEDHYSDDRNAPPFHSMSQVFSPSTDASTVLKSVDWPDFAECRALTRFSSRARISDRVCL